MPFDILGKIAQVPIAAAPYALIKARGDGNCLFHAAGHLLERAGLLAPEHNTHATFRAHVVAYVAAHAKETNALGFKLRDGLGITRNAQGAVTEAQGRQIDQRVAYLGVLNNWGDEACLTAIESLYDVEALVYDRTGADTNAFDLRHYEPSRSPATKLRLCAQFVGSAPYHYDCFLPNAEYAADRDGPDQTIVPEVVADEVESVSKKPSAPRRAPAGQWAYHLGPEGLKPYGPPIAHRQMAYTAAVLDGKVAAVKKPVGVALGDKANVVLAPPAPVTAVQLVNRSKGGDLASRSFSLAQGKEALALAHRERLFLPLQRQEGICVNLADASTTELVLEIEEGKARQPTEVFGAVYSRALGRRAVSSAGDGLVADFPLDLSKIEGEKVEDEGGARMRYTIPAATVLDAKLVKFLTWEGSPYQLVIGSAEQLGAASSAWTHFHVPSEWDVNTAEALGQVPVLMLNEDLSPLASAGCGAKVQAVANTNLDGEKPTAKETFELPGEVEARLKELMIAAGRSGIDWNAGNYLVEVEGGNYIATSWASMVHLALNPEDGCYYADALYCAGNVRFAYRATIAEMDGVGARRDAGAAYLVPLASVTACRAKSANYRNALDRLHGRLEASSKVALAYAQAEMAVKGELLEQGKILHTMTPSKIADTVNKAMSERHGKLRAEHEQLQKERSGLIKEATAQCQQLCLELNTALGLLRADAALARFLTEKKIVMALGDDVAFVEQNPSLSRTRAVRLNEELDRVYKALYDQKQAAIGEGIELPITARVEGVKDFDIGGGKVLAKGEEWKQYLFEEPLKLTQVVTAGISSCAGGVTFSTEEVPEHVFLWHIDANLSVPLRPEIERLWPGGKGMPDLRSIVVVNPSPWEINKYRPENLYPAGTLERCETVFLPRSCHLYADQPVVAGCDRFGVDVSQENRVDVVFTYDFEKRTEALSVWKKPDVVELPEILRDFQDNLYGAYRDQDADVKTPEAMGAYITAVTEGNVEALQAIKRRKRAGANKSCRIESLTAKSFESLKKSSTPLLETDCQFANEKGDLELAAVHTHRWTPGS